MYKLNPSVFIYNNHFYSLVRCETDVKNWSKSKLSYNLCKLDKKFNVITEQQCTFKINNEMFTTTPERNLLNSNLYCIEDIKIIKLRKQQK